MNNNKKNYVCYECNTEIMRGEQFIPHKGKIFCSVSCLEKNREKFRKIISGIIEENLIERNFVTSDQNNEEMRVSWNKEKTRETIIEIVKEIDYLEEKK